MKPPETVTLLTQDVTAHRLPGRPEFKGLVSGAAGTVARIDDGDLTLMMPADAVEQWRRALNTAAAQHTLHQEKQAPPTADAVEGYLTIVADAIDDAGISTRPPTIDQDESLGGAILMPDALGDGEGLALVWDKDGWQLGFYNESGSGIECLTALGLGRTPPHWALAGAVRRAVAAVDKPLAAAVYDGTLPDASWDDLATLARYTPCGTRHPGSNAARVLTTDHGGEHIAAAAVPGGQVRWEGDRG